MTTISTDAASRREASRSSDGKFGHQAHSESDVSIAPGQPVTPAPQRAPVPRAFASTAFTGAVADFRDAQELKVFADYVRTTYPGAVAICPSFGEDDCSVQYRRADGTEDWVDFEDDESPILYGMENNLAQMNSDRQGWIALDAIDEQYASTEDHYAEALINALVPARVARSVSPVGDLPEQVPAGHRINTGFDNQGDSQARLVDENGQTVVTTTLSGYDQVYTEVNQEAPEWADDCEDEIQDMLVAAATNRSVVESAIRGRMGAVPRLTECIDALCSRTR